VSPDLTSLSLAQLLALRNAINAEIKGRGHTRTATSLEGELMERVVADAYGGTLAPPTRKSVDVLLPDGRSIQVKTRSLPRGDMRFWQFDDLEFDFAVVISMDRETAEIVFAREVSREELHEHAAMVASGAVRLRMGKARTVGADVTTALQEAYRTLR
jgi:hypothetical protein